MMFVPSTSIKKKNITDCICSYLWYLGGVLSGGANGALIRSTNLVLFSSAAIFSGCNCIRPLFCLDGATILRDDAWG